MFLFHPSSIGLLMSDAQSIDPAFLTTQELRDMAKKKTKTDAEKAILGPLKEQSLSAGAKTELKTMAKEFIFSYHKTVETKFMDKGLMLEDRAIEFLSRFELKRYTKNKERLKDDLLTGECDILVPGVETIDTKVSWDVSTFPLLTEDAHDPMYEWQGRAYMRLNNVPQHRVAFILLDTPEELIKPWDQEELHRVEQHPEHLRITTITYLRDMELEAKMVRKLTIAKEYMMNTIARINLEHRELA